ncbi:hypothetical protein [Micromonospora sp. RTP1Z1]|uniref:hypothetical protein n=1 Tax=Micromonospora sp. RTP1Z1 TaxID=2994043 RepID=UPI0029C7E68D|nr:hypothetical protein [Micromonospora sp. RTP1Z1]
MTDDLDAETLAFAHRMFDLTRGGATEELAEYVDAGLPVNMTNDKGDTLLLDAGADPDHGNPSAVETAHFFDLPEMLAALGRS